MSKIHRNGRATAQTSIEDEIVHLRGLDLKGLRARWQSVLQRPAPDHLPRHLLFAIIAYRIQADRFGDLDHEMRQLCEPLEACAPIFRASPCPLKPVGRCVRPTTCMLVAESACPTFRRTLRSCSERRSTMIVIALEAPGYRK